MNVEPPVELATSRADAEAAEAVRRHHAQMAGTLAVKVQALIASAAAGRPSAVAAARAALVSWCEAELVPHAAAEERAMYPAAQVMAQGRLLIDGMLAEHAVIRGLVAEVAHAEEPVAAAAAARALQVMFETHLAKENDLVLPLLVQAPAVSVAHLLAGMHDLLGGDERADQTPQPGSGHHGCQCGEVDAPTLPELDARSIPHAIRHATIFGALDAVAAGGGLVLVAPHDPLPLLAQVADRYRGGFTVDYLERGPEAWRLEFRRG